VGLADPVRLFMLGKMVEEGLKRQFNACRVFIFESHALSPKLRGDKVDDYQGMNSTDRISLSLSIVFPPQVSL
jgi:hypothetical protein